MNHDLVYFAAIEGTCEMSWPFEVIDFSYDLEFNGTNRYDEPEDDNPDNGLQNPFDHSRPIDDE